MLKKKTTNNIKLLSAAVSVGILLSICFSVPPVSATDLNIEADTLVEVYSPRDGSVDSYFVDEDGSRVERETANYDENSLMGVESAASTLPAAYDLRDTGIITPPKDQGTTETCWAFSAIGAMESYAIKNSMRTAANCDFSEAHLVWFTQNPATSDTSDPTYGDGMNISNPFSTGSNWRRLTATLARGSGLELEANKPFYNYYSGYSNMEFSNNERYKTYSRLTDTSCIADYAQSINDREKIKQALYDNGALMASYYTTSSGYINQYPSSSSDITAFYQNSYTTVNHGVLIVGWDDNFSLTNFSATNRPSQNGAFLCRNSWSADWGNSGFFWISYYDTSLQSFIQFELADVDIYDNIHQYDGAGWSSRLSASNVVTAKAANRFTAIKSETLTHVGFSTDETINADYTVDVYIHVSGTSNPTNGTRMTSSSVSGNLTHSGYHTVELAAPVSLTAGMVYSVVVTMTEKNSSRVYIPVEGADTSTRSYASGARQSYVGFVNSSTQTCSWYDTTSVSGTNYNNVTIKALTSNIRTPFSYELNTGYNTILDTANNYIYGLEPGITEQELENRFYTEGDGHIEVTSANGVIGTGATVSFIDDILGEIYNCTVIIYGDADGSGTINQLDMTMLKAHVSGVSPINLHTANYVAVDLSADGVLIMNDLTYLKIALSGNGHIDQRNGTIVYG